MSIILYKRGDQFGIKTNCRDSSQFSKQLASLMSNMINRGVFGYPAPGHMQDSDWNFQFQGWLPEFGKIFASYEISVRYKEDAQGVTTEERVIDRSDDYYVCSVVRTSGDCVPGSNIYIWCTREGSHFGYSEATAITDDPEF